MFAIVAFTLLIFFHYYLYLKNKSARLIDMFIIGLYTGSLIVNTLLLLNIKGIF